MTHLRYLKDNGKKLFRQILQDLSSGSGGTDPVARLHGGVYSADFEPRVVLEDQSFKTRYALGVYLHQLLQDVDYNDLFQEGKDIWTWLAVYYFDDICPAKSNGTRSVKEEAKYIFIREGAWNRYYRHLIYSSYAMVRKHGQHAKLLMSCPLHVHPDIFEQIGSRHYFVQYENLIQLAYRLYWDEKKKRVKKGATDRKNPGSLRRLESVLNQLDLTYDLYSMSVDQIIKFLPAEFEPWVNDPVEGEDSES